MAGGFVTEAKILFGYNVSLGTDVPLGIKI